MKLSAISYTAGLDLAQCNEPTAFTIIERRDFVGEHPHEEGAAEYHLRNLERFNSGTLYQEIFKHVREARLHAQVEDGPLIVDCTGIGDATVKLLRKLYPGVYLEEVRIISGMQAIRDEQGEWLIPKKELVSVLQVMLQTHALKIPQSLSLANVLAEELTNFSAKIAPSTAENQIDWRQGKHDDLVFAVAIPCWWAERFVQTAPDLIAANRCRIEEAFGRLTYERDDQVLHGPRPGPGQRLYRFGDPGEDDHPSL